MATKLLKPVIRHDLRSHLVVTLAPEGLYLREQGRRFSVGPLPYESLYLRAVRSAADAQRSQRRATARPKRMRLGL